MSRLLWANNETNHRTSTWKKMVLVNSVRIIKEKWNIQLISYQLVQLVSFYLSNLFNIFESKTIEMFKKCSMKSKENRLTLIFIGLANIFNYYYI
jgi:hypothetical protein